MNFVPSKTCPQEIGEGMSSREALFQGDSKEAKKKEAEWALLQGDSKEAKEQEAVWA
jgi:hypothetical protein